jgi:hypothetical protein
MWIAFPPIVALLFGVKLPNDQEMWSASLLPEIWEQGAEENIWTKVGWK